MTAAIFYKDKMEAFGIKCQNLHGTAYHRAIIWERVKVELWLCSAKCSTFLWHNSIIFSPLGRGSAPEESLELVK